MPPKKGGGKKKTKSSSRNKGEKEPQLTLKEAILAFQIEIKEKDLQAKTHDFRVLREKNRRLKERNEQLKNEQQEHFKILLKQSKESEKEVEQTTVVNASEVEASLVDKINTMKELVAEENEIKNQISGIKDGINDASKLIRERLTYKDIGKHVHGKQIAVLRKKLSEMETSFNEVSAHLDRGLTIFKEEIQQEAQSALIKQKSVASEEASNSITKNDQQEITDHKWLKKEISIHLQAFEDMTVAVEALERGNLEIMQELFDCKEQDLNLARKFYLACVNDEHDSDEEVVMSHGELNTQEEIPHDHIFDNYLIFDDDESTESPRLGPLDLQLLSVVGTKKPIHETSGSQTTLLVSTSALQHNDLDRTESEVWPVSEQMLQTMVIK